MPRLGLLFFAIVVSHSHAQSSTDFNQLDWVVRDQLPLTRQAQLPSFCSGDYLPPSLSITQGKALHVQSDSADVKESLGATFLGNVQLQQVGQQVQADSAQYNQLSGEAQFSGDVLYRNGDISMTADLLNYNTQTGQARLQHAQYVIAPLHMRGDAESLEIHTDNSVYLTNSSYTFCEPGHNDWDIKASEINLFKEKSYGEAYHARLRIKEVPVLYLPYFRFPLSEGRLSGFLNPQISLSAKGIRNSDNENITLEKTEIKVEHFATPFYFNIAPNYDDTLTPRYLSDHGILTENEFRYLNFFGQGEFSIGYISSDSAHLNDTNGLSDEALDEQRPKERWSKSLHHQGNITQYWQDRINYQEVSDADYSEDFNRLGLIDRTDHLIQNAELEYNDGDWQFLTLVEKFQTKDENIADSEKNFYRLPHAEFSSLSSYEVNQFNYEFSMQTTIFSRDNTELTGVNKINAERFHSDLTFSYPLEASYGFLTPSLQFMHTQYNFQDVDEIAVGLDYKDKVERNIHIASLDSGLFFERNFQLLNSNYSQTLEPRIMLAHIPYVNQSQIPIYDSTLTPFSYSELFSPNRFTNPDRIGDTQQLSLGLTTRFINGLGEEVFRASVGQIRYAEDRRVILDPGITTLKENANESVSRSPVASELEWRFYPGWRFKADMLYNPHAIKAQNIDESDAEPIEKAGAQLTYLDEDNWILDMNFSHIEETKQKQVGLAFFVPINDRWAFYAQKKHDIWPYNEEALLEKEEEEEHFLNIEGLAGIEYQNCCWRVQFTYEEHTKSDKSRDYKYLIQVHFKGLGILGTDTDSILSDRIFGYEDREIHDY